MAMIVEKGFTVRAPRQTVWNFLTDPASVARCLPGAAITGQSEDGGWLGTMAIKVGPVTASYRGKLKFERLDEAAGEAELVASGQETKGKGGADMKMRSKVTAASPEETAVNVVSEVNVYGVLAQMGRGMIQDVSDQLFGKFTAAMRRELETDTPAAVPLAPAASPLPPGEGQGEGGKPQSAPSPPPSPQPSPGGRGSTAAAPSPREEVLDVGALGAAAAGRAAGRVVRRPLFWIVLIALAWLLYRWLR
jgi:uncharacterized protein